MSLPIVYTPPVLNRLFKPYKSFLSKPQFKHFKRFITGLIVSNNKPLQEINDAFWERNQSNLNRFINGNIDAVGLNRLRLRQIKDTLCLRKKGIILIDESLLHKIGRKMDLAGSHRSGIIKKIEWGYMIVNCVYTDTDGNECPIKTDLYLKEKDCANRQFYTKREIALQKIYYVRQEGFDGLVIVDVGRIRR